MAAQLFHSFEDGQWFRNCVAMWLAGGFLEPLESTGLYQNEIAAEMLTERYPHGDDMEPLAFRFNRIMRNRCIEILDFISMHCCLSRRTDTEIWHEARRPERVNDRLRANIECWRIKPPTASEFVDQYFPGQRDECDDWFGKNRPRPAIHRQVLDAVNTAQEKLPPHDAWLKRMVGMPDYPTA